MSSPPKRTKSITPRDSKDASTPFRDAEPPTSPPPVLDFDRERKPSKEAEKKPTAGTGCCPVNASSTFSFTRSPKICSFASSQALLLAAEENIRSDLETYKRLVPQKATTPVTLWHLTDRTFELFWKRILLKEEEFREKFREVYSDNPDKLDSRFNTNSAEDKDVLRHFGDLKEASASLDRFQNPPIGRDPYEIKRITQELVDTCSDVTQVVNVPLDLVGKIARLKKLCEKSVYTIGVVVVI